MKPNFATLRRAIDIADHIRHRDGPPKCLNCKRDLADVPSFGACPDCGADN